MKTIISLFDDPLVARQAFEQLQSTTFPVSDVSLVSRANTDTLKNDADVSASDGAAVGAVWGGLIGLAALLIPGIGPLVAVGALGVALTGAVAGAVVGGIAAALIDFGGLSEDEVKHYETMIENGKTLVAAKVDDNHIADVENLLAQYQTEPMPANLHSIESPATVAIYHEDGSRLNTPTATEGYVAPLSERRIDPVGTVDDPVADDTDIDPIVPPIPPENLNR